VVFSLTIDSLSNACFCVLCFVSARDLAIVFPASHFQIYAVCIFLNIQEVLTEALSHKI
jgi:hypothetical protein